MVINNVILCAGTFKDIEVRITVERDVLFDIDLPTPLEDPVRLYLEYTNVVTQRKDRQTTSAMYTNVSTIRHIEFDSDVNFEQFEVSVALESNTGVREPITSAQGQYGKHIHVHVYYWELIIIIIYNVHDGIDPHLQAPKRVDVHVYMYMRALHCHRFTARLAQTGVWADIQGSSIVYYWARKAVQIK